MKGSIAKKGKMERMIEKRRTKIERKNADRNYKWEKNKHIK